MKKYLFLILFLTTVSGIFAQNEQNAEQGSKLPGNIVLANGNIKEGFIQRFSKIKSQKKVRFFDKVDDKKYVEYKPEELKSYTVADAYYESLPYEGFTQKAKVFMERTLSGKMNVFTYYLYTKDLKPKEYSYQSEGKTVTYKDYDGESLSGEMILVKEDGEQLNLSSVKVIMGFKTVLSKYTAACVSLSQKISNKESGYNVLGIIKIVEEYNTCN